jgi:signal transduction histidine kinase
VLERTEKHVRELVTEQAALRQVATLVAREPSPDRLFADVAKQVARVFDVPHVRLVRYEPEGSVVVAGFSEQPDGPFPIGSRWPLESAGVIASVRHTGRPARVEDYSDMTGEIAAVVRGAGMHSAVASPIVVARRLWGAMVVLCARDDPLPPDTEARLTDFTELVATAIANAEARGALATVADEQAALRRVATLVASGGGPEPLFQVVAEEVSALLAASASVILRFEDDGTATTLGTHGDDPAVQQAQARRIGTRTPLDPGFVMSSVRNTRRAARFDTDDPTAASMPAIVRETGARSFVASPIVVEGELWGAIGVGSLVRSLPPDTERRLVDFTELVATAVANSQAREQLRALADEQAALGRVATLVARGARPEKIFSAVSDEVGRLFDSDQASVTRFDPEGPAIVVVGVAQSIEEIVAVGTRWELHDTIASAHVFRTGRSARIDRNAASSAGGPAFETIARLDLQSTVASPIVVEGKLWGTITVSSSAEPLPADTEQRLEKFTELVATAIANAESRTELAASEARTHDLATEQAALRRVATLVALQPSPSEVFTAVAQAVGLVLDADLAVLHVFSGDGEATTIASWSRDGPTMPIGSRFPLTGDNLAARIFESGAPARIYSHEEAWARAETDVARSLRMHSAVGAPILVEGKLWGALMAATRDVEPWAENAETRLAAFTELVATAIANADNSAELAASRRRIVAAADEARRRIERDLHDGIQQRLIALTFRARAMTRKPPADLPGLARELADGLKDASDELREVSRGIHPTVLTEAGLGPALRALARRSTVPIEVDVRLDARLAEEIEAAAYYIASEALTNVAKHARANVVHLMAAHDEGGVTLEVRDDGIGGVDPGHGSGILGLTDRVEALGGTISITSPPHGGTTLSVRLPDTA